MKSLIQIINEYKGAALHNSRKSIGDPDGITYDFKEGKLNVDWDPENGSAYAFIYNKKKNKIIFSDSGYTHRDIFGDYEDSKKWKDSGFESLNDPHQLRYVGSYYDSKEEISEWYKKNKEVLKNICSGRIWYFEKLSWSLERWNEDYVEDNPNEFKDLKSVKDFKDTHAIIAFWNDITPSKFKEYCDNIVKLFNEEKDKDINITKYIAVGNNGEPIYLDINESTPIKVKKRTTTRQKEIEKIMDLHNPAKGESLEEFRKRKKEALKGYNKARGEHFQRDYYNQTKSKTAAEWHNNKTKRYNPHTGKMEWGEKIGDSLQMKNLKDYVCESWEHGEVKNMKLRKMLNKEGLQDVHLAKGKGYFYLFSTGDSEISDLVNSMYDTSIYVNSFRQQSVQQWFDDIMDMINKAKNDNIN